jgi:hypothetical protein
MNTHLKLLMAIACGFLAMLFVGSAFSANLVPNGDFELDNTLFGSDYTYSPGDGFPASVYTVATSPFPWHTAFIDAGDHTSGSGKMYVGNGASVDSRVWFSSGISTTANTAYFFEAWVMNVCCSSGGPVSPAVLSFYANGQLLGTPSTSLLGVWEGLSTTWNSGTSTSVDLEIRNSNFAAGGNDFAVDDIFLGTQSTVVPEPSTFILLLAGLLGVSGLGYWRQRRQNYDR